MRFNNSLISNSINTISGGYKLEELKLKELKRIEEWYTNHEDDMTSSDLKIYDKINLIIEEMEDSNEDSLVPTGYDEENEEEKEELFYEPFEDD